MGRSGGIPLGATVTASALCRGSNYALDALDSYATTSHRVVDAAPVPGRAGPGPSTARGSVAFIAAELSTLEDALCLPTANQRMVDALNEYVRLADYAHDDLGDTHPISCGWRIGWPRRR